MRGRLGAVLPAVAATVTMAVVLGGLVTGAVVLLTAGDEAATAARVLRIWAVASAIALPVGFVFGVPLLAVVRSLRRRRPALGPEAEGAGDRPEAGDDRGTGA